MNSKSAVLVFLACGSWAIAGTVSVENDSFESPAIGGVPFTGGYIPTGVIPVSNWTASELVNTGVFSPSPASYLGVPDGSQILYIQNSGSTANSVAQQLADTLAASTLYMLSASVGFRIDGAYVFGGYDLHLFVEDGCTLVSLANTSSTVFGQPQGTFQQVSVVYDSSTLLDLGLLGKPLIIRLGTLTPAGASVAESDWDNVQLESLQFGRAAVVPEPSTFAVLGMALAAIGLWDWGVRRRIRKRSSCRVP